MITITVRKQFIPFISKSVLINSLTLIQKQLFPAMDFDLGVLICSDIEIQKLNFIYRHIDAPTDVLSFGSDEVNPETGVPYLGDLTVSYEKARAQALSAHHDVMTEITILLIHGFLHLLGFNHDTQDMKKEMWKKQYQAHELLHIKIDSLPGEHD